MSVEPTVPFSELGLAAEVLRAVDEVGYEAPSSIQAEAIPPLLAGRDLLGQAQTGTGKTAAFALPLLSRLDLRRREPQVLVLTPTRELAIQVAEAIQTYARYLKGFHVVPIYGGQSIDGQLRHLRRGVHVVVGTPGRVQDHLRRGSLSLDALQTVVLDEADEMLRMGFLEEVETILDQMPEKKQVALFSATMPTAIRKVARRYLQDPVEIHIATKTATVATVRQRYWRVTGAHKLDALTRILEIEDFDAMLIFVRTKVATVELAEKLEARGFASSPLNGDMGQALRERTVERLKNGKLDIVVATDVAARGLHVERISHVVNYDAPYDVESYVHRIGRTARAGRKGEALLFLAPRERHMLYSIEKVTRQPITAMLLPTHQELSDHRVAQFNKKITDALDSQDLDYFAQVVDNYRREHDTDVLRIASALAFLAQKERPLAPPKRPVAARRGVEKRPPGEDRRPSAKPHPSDRRDFGSELQRYRVEVGHEHGVQPGNIVGAIASEAGLQGHQIGRIKILGAFSLVELPSALPEDVLRHLKGVRVCGQALRIVSDPGMPKKIRTVYSKPRPADDKTPEFVKSLGKRKLGKKKPGRKKAGKAGRKKPKS